MLPRLISFENIQDWREGRKRKQSPAGFPRGHVTAGMPWNLSEPWLAT